MAVYLRSKVGRQVAELGNSGEVTQLCGWSEADWDASGNVTDRPGLGLKREPQPYRLDLLGPVGSRLKSQYVQSLRETLIQTFEKSVRDSQLYDR